jgi:hypothetical protein
MATAIAGGTHVAVVRGADSVLFTASGSSDAEIAASLVTYIAERCDDVLWPADANEVRRLIDAHREDEAIARYFASVGQRWDEERLYGSGSEPNAWVGGAGLKSWRNESQRSTPSTRIPLREEPTPAVNRASSVAAGMPLAR